jgi:peptide/nickel transport system permease protein
MTISSLRRQANTEPSRQANTDFALKIAALTAITWVITRVLIYLIPGDPAEFLSHDALVTSTVEQMRTQMDLEGSWAERILRAPNLKSLIYQTPVYPMVVAAFQKTLLLTVICLVEFAALTTLLLWLSTLNLKTRNRIHSLSIAISSVPTFVLGPVLLLIFSIYFNWFPVTQSVWLPSITLAIYLSGFWFRNLSHQLEQYRIRSAEIGARARGTPEFLIFIRYLLVPCLGGYFGFFGSQIATLLNGSVIVEIIFQWNGVGQLLAEAIVNRDYPMIEGSIFVLSLAGLVSIQMGRHLQNRWEARLQ